MPREISLRITAIRETFEECGVLLCKKQEEKKTLTQWAEHLVTDEAKSWQSRVHNDSTEFYRMCKDCGCYPNIWVLHEWSNWLTPSWLPKRFDTIFYMACMQSQPLAEVEKKEMEDLTVFFKIENFFCIFIFSCFRKCNKFFQKLINESIKII